ncbi:sulfite exporter TauE/SafE family protein [Neobacillus sp. MM2021_6]|uniref:sulfite exporter TauE/SafE family protein n=1 Tax=Bacillaceae TaxID=186817 RepID=UPI00140882ED|nr:MULTISPECIES: sulfite exporter TauE/SafE family protein [Bacillaceae]MBO0961595.1 sulfite exporter TauE/SafE family protein [Neobacillus sp. MM2021_6]NHC19489.1 sulfite exporter TauE/SafE family protein [Bacillus sp. MM2020_4]WML38579.1 sulfite exporter TauE/SafE family protein [Neobacillus sp. OS1-2]
MSFISVLFLGFVLGIKHSIEPDHIIAVSTMVGKSNKLSRSTLTGVFWGIGHTSTLFIVGMILVLMKGELSEKWAMSLEFLVGIMLVYLGIKSMLFFNNFQRNSDNHARSSFIKITFIGFIHGLAGSAAMVILTMSTASSVWECALYILIFGAGTIIGMLMFTTIIGIPFVYSKKSVGLNRRLTQFAGTVSFLFGIYYMYNLGITEGLFQMWVQ